MKHLILLASLLALSACELKGTMTVDSEFAAIDKKGKTHQIAVGAYRTEMEYDEGDRELKLEIKNAAGQDEVELKLLVPVGQQTPERGQSFSYSARDIGQSFGVKGQSTELFEQSSPLRGTEACSYIRYVRTCTGRGLPRRPGRRGQCYDRAVTYIGHRTIEYRLNTTTHVLDLQFVESNGERILARSSAQASTTQQQIIYRGSCYR